ncbi:GNAT family N-acetyltransferase [Actinopolymorpha pittospori]
MSSIQVRPFRRSDRDQLTQLVNSHVQAVLPGVSLSVSTVLNHLDRDPGEFIEDPWVAERTTLVAEQQERLVAAAHLQRYAAEPRVGEDYRGAGVIRWLVCWPPDSPWADATQVGDALARACLVRFDRWQVARRYADGSLPAPAVYGVPDQWPHVRAIYERAGFAHSGRTEVILLARVDHLPRPSQPPLPGLAVRRSVGVNGTRFSASFGERVIGSIEVAVLADGERVARLGGWADIGNLHVVEDHRRRGVATWLLGQVGEWLRLAGVERVLDYALPEQEDTLALLRSVGFVELTRTARGWVC